MRRWACSAQFELTAGELSNEAHLYLTKKSLRRAPHKPGHYVFTRTIDAEGDEQAVLAFRGELRATLGPYGVGFEVYSLQITEVR
ncbi:hypothetical protein ACFV9C_25500 [Kribbella sp. NPDC059898]|uniref:hypothetical protein n=1 Tax=Kribbella sp. NPDC059898 TaxID=3346995 RepID=UPI003654016D